MHKRARARAKRFFLHLRDFARLPRTRVANARRFLTPRPPSSLASPNDRLDLKAPYTPETRTMARSKQTERKSTGGGAPRKQLATKAQADRK